MLIALHVVTITYAILMIALLTRQISADRKSRVLLLIESELTLPPLFALLACFAALIPIVWAVFTSNVIPRESPGHFATFVVSLTLGFVVMLLLVATAVMKRTSLGSLTFIDEKTLRVKLGEHAKEVVVTSVRIAKTGGSELATWALYEVSDGREAFYFFGALPIPKWKDIAGEIQPPTGTLIAGSSLKLFDWVQPFITSR